MRPSACCPSADGTVCAITSQIVLLKEFTCLHLFTPQHLTLGSEDSLPFLLLTAAIISFVAFILCNYGGRSSYKQFAQWYGRNELPFLLSWEPVWIVY